MRERSRRRLLQATGAAAAFALAGCGGDGNGDSGNGNGDSGNGNGDSGNGDGDSGYGNGDDGSGSGNGDSGNGSGSGDDSSGDGMITADATYDPPVSDPSGILYKSEYSNEAGEEVASLIVADGSAQEEYIVELDGISGSAAQRYTPETPGDEVTARGITWSGSLLLTDDASNTLVEHSLGGVNTEVKATDLPADPKGLFRADNSSVVYAVLARSDGDVLAELNRDFSVRREMPIPGGSGYGMFTQNQGATFKIWVNSRDLQFHNVRFGEEGTVDSFDTDFGPVTDVTTAGPSGERAWALTDAGEIVEFSPPPISES